MTRQCDSRGPDAPLTQEALGDLRRNLARLSTPGLEAKAAQRKQWAELEAQFRTPAPIVHRHPLSPPCRRLC